MSSIINQSIAQLEEFSKKEVLQKYQTYIDKFSNHGCKLNIEFGKEVIDSSKKCIYKAKVFILPENISKSEALKHHKVKYFSGRVFEINKKENNHFLKKCNDIFLPLYFKVMYLRLCYVKKEKFFNEGILDLFVKVLFQHRLGIYSDNFRGHNISFIPIILFIAFIIIATLIGTYYDILIADNLGWR